METPAEKSFAAQMLEIENSLHNAEKNETAMIEEAEKKEDEKKIQKEKTILDVIMEEENLSQEQIDAWKDQYKKIYAARFEANECFIFRYIARPEWKQIQQKLQGIKTTDPNLLAEMEDEMVFDKCVIYPDVNANGFKAMLKAGTIATVATQIRVASNFLPDSVALELIVKL